VRAAVAAAGAAERSGAAGAGVRRRPVRPSALTLPAGLLLALAAGGLLLSPPAGFLLAAFAGAVVGLLAGGRAEPPLAARVIGLLEAGAAVLALGVDGADGGGHRFVTATANGRPPPAAGASVGMGAGGHSARRARSSWSARRSLIPAAAASWRAASRASKARTEWWLSWGFVVPLAGLEPATCCLEEVSAPSGQAC
jgi:hypothetical protein